MSWYCRPTNWSRECVPANWMPLVPELVCEIAIISLNCEMSKHLDADEDGVQPTSSTAARLAALHSATDCRGSCKSVALSPPTYKEELYSLVAAASVVGRGAGRRRSDVPTLRRLFARDSQIIVSESSGAALWPKLRDRSQVMALKVESPGKA